MKLLLCLIMLLMCAGPTYSGNTTLLERQIIRSAGGVNYLSVYAPSREENARRAIRLGYDNFHVRFAAHHPIPSDLKIARFVKEKLIVFLEDFKAKQQDPNLDQTILQKQAEQTFSELATELARLLYRNQQRYINPLVISDEIALQETVFIIQHLVDTGTF